VNYLLLHKRIGVHEIGSTPVQLNHDKARWVDLAQGGSFGFLGFDFRRVKTRRGIWGVRYVPKLKARTALLQKLKDIFRRFRSQPVDRVVSLINPILRGWVNYFRGGQSSRCFGYVKDWVEKKIRRHMMRARKYRGFGWKRWSRAWIYEQLGLFSNYRVVRL
jgi:RNA-directed DNA polymerase